MCSAVRADPDQVLAFRLVGHHLDFALYIVALRGVYCLGPRRGRVTPFVRTDQWLGAPRPDADPTQAGAELVRRYPACFGPSTPDHFAAWAGIAPEHARRLWRRVESELLPMQVGQRTSWLHRQDLARLQAPAAAEGVRLLPPHDPYLEQRDRQIMLLTPTRALSHRGA